VNRMIFRFGRLPLVLIVSLTALAQQPATWGPWIPVNDGYQSRISISFKKSSSCTSSTCLYYWRFQNGYEAKVHLECDLLITDQRGRQVTDTCAAGSLPPGEIRTNGGWWTSSATEPKVAFKKLRAASESSALPPATISNPGMGDVHLSELRAMQYAKQRSSVESQIAQLTAQIAIEIGKARGFGIPVNPYLFALKQFLRSTPTVDEATERRQLAEARAEYERRLRAKQELEGDLAKAHVVP
jgi:hypothetical protein